MHKSRLQRPSIGDPGIACTLPLRRKMARSGRNLLKRNLRDIGTVAGVLDGHCHDLTRGIDIEQGVFVEISRFADLALAEFDIERIGVLKILDVHGEKPR